MESIAGESRFLRAVRCFGEVHALIKTPLLVLLLFLLWLWPALVIADEARWEQYMGAAGAAYQRGDYEEAVGKIKAALKEAQDFGEQDPRYAETVNNLALLYHAQGRYIEAEPLHRRALAIREKALGPEHPHVALSLNNLAGIYQTQGRFGEAEPLDQRSLTINEKALGPEHPNTTITLNNLAELYRAQGRNEDAERLLRKHGQ